MEFDLRRGSYDLPSWAIHVDDI